MRLAITSQGVFVLAVKLCFAGIAVLTFGCAARQVGVSEGAEEIAHGIQSSVAAHPDISDYSLRVNVRGSHVTLGGTTKNALQSRMIESVAFQTPGVSDVTNEIVVEPGPSDLEIKEAIFRELELDGSLFIDLLSVQVENGVVKLSGSMPERDAVDSILSHALNTPGVKDIKSNMTINGDPYPVSYLEMED